MNPIELLYDLSKKLSFQSFDEFWKALSDGGPGDNPALLVGACLMLLGIASLALLLLFSSSRKSKTEEVDGDVLFRLNSRLNTLESALQEQKTAIKHLSQKAKSNEGYLKAELDQVYRSMEEILIVVNPKTSREFPVRKAA